MKKSVQAPVSLKTYGSNVTTDVSLRCTTKLAGNTNIGAVLAVELVAFAFPIEGITAAEFTMPVQAGAGY